MTPQKQKTPRPQGFVNVAIPREEYSKVQKIKAETGRSIRHIITEMIRLYR